MLCRSCLNNSPTDQTIRGWLAGGQLGYNHQFGRAVVGFELSGSWGNLNGQSVGASPGALVVTGSTPTSLGCSQLLNVSPGGTSVSVACSAKVDWTAQAVVRLGRTFGDGRFLPYLEGGLSFVHMSIATSINELIGFVTATDSFGRSGVLPGAVLGGGAQYAFGNGFSIGAEYLYARYASQDFSGSGTATCAPGCGTPVQTLIVHTAQENRDLSSSTIRAVLNYKLAD